MTRLGAALPTCTSVNNGDNGGGVNAVPGSPNGFEDRTDCTLSWSDATRTLTLAGTYAFWSDGTRFESTGESFQITDVEGSHFVYYDETGTLTETTSFDLDLIQTFCLVAYVTWDATNDEAVPDLVNEQHGTGMASDTHLYLHTTVGAAYVSGLGLTITSVDGTGNDNDNARFSSDAGATRDEDIPHTIAARGTTDPIPVLYRDGADGNWRMDDDAEYPVLKGTLLAYWNEWTGATWQLTEIVGNNNFVLAHIYAVPGVTPSTGYLATIMGQAEYGSTAAARAGAETEIWDLDVAGLPSAEFFPLATIIFQTSTNYSNTVASRTRKTDLGDDYIDWRPRRRS